MRGRFNIWLFVAVVVALPISVYAVVNWYEKTVQTLPVMVSKTHTIADYQLINQLGNDASTKNWKDKIVVANFFFTHCLSVCPKMTNNLKKVEQANTGNKDLLFVSFSVDPERDSSEQLQNFAHRFNIDANNWQ